MIPFNKLYDYPILERVTLDTGRYYVDPTGEKLSSVTTILSATSDNTFLIRWRNKVGDEEADRIVLESTDIGSLMHSHLENYVAGKKRDLCENAEYNNISEIMADMVISHGLKHVDEIYGMEEILYLPGYYAGTADLIGLHEGVPSIMDYKTTRKMKKKDDIVNYKHQMAAYAIAHNYLFGTEINKGVIFMVSRDYQFEEYVFEGDEFLEAQEQWLERVQSFERIQRIKERIKNQKS